MSDPRPSTSNVSPDATLAAHVDDEHAPTIRTDDSLGALVTRHPGVARELERRGLDYCCGGARTLADACVEIGLDPEVVAAELAPAAASRPAEVWAHMGVAQLVDHLESTHHRYLWDELPRVVALTEKIDEVHGSRHPELAELRMLVAELRADLEPHLTKEERALFPMVRELATADRAPEFHCGSLGNPISVMLTEHDRAGELLERMRTITSDYTPPADGCATYAETYRALEALEADTHLHVHKENNLLFPAVLALEDRLAAT